MNDQLNLNLGREKRDLGMARADAHVDPWRAAANDWIEGLPVETIFTAEDLCQTIGRPERVNAVGARLSAWARQGKIAELAYVQAHRPSRHASRMLRWIRL